ncbi:hypothetical protein [Accumulibacter sp.]|uniref:Uncharacterized protein n=1 Tax=Candidatus Accumulibacter proximus TaxID=2954385 RepID=A0A935PUV8_9PROT|nr:hypothetical protein [Accumulibacter sp.]MBK7673765.1 hypothetical protein [Candidatus Accumulibacter proximus]MBL8374731.1 hypothetical protein [Accumulibacter sp.]
MKVLMVMEGNHRALRIEPEDEEGRALLAAYGVMGTYQAKLGATAGLLNVSAAPTCASYEKEPAELD